MGIIYVVDNFFILLIFLSIFTTVACLLRLHVYMRQHRKHQCTFFQVKAGSVPPLVCVVVVALVTHTWGMSVFGLNSSVPLVNATFMSDSGACWEFFKVHGSE